jgi:hypothetical protein
VARDGGTGPLLVKNLPRIHWQSVETWSTGRGVPDYNFCCDGVEGWLELKKSSGWAVDMEPEQIAWAERRLRHGGRLFILVRRKEDELWLFHGSAARELKLRGLKELSPMARWSRPWPWEELGRLLLSR